MKKLSRLTALLLALLMLITSMPQTALADTVTVDVNTWNNWVADAQKAAFEKENTTETVTTTTTVTGTTDVVDRPVVEAALTTHAGTETSVTQSVGLPIAGKLVLSAYSGASSYQWQVKVGDQWANVMGDTGAAITLTYAKVQTAMSGSSAQVRCRMTVNGKTYVSATANVTVDETVTYTTVETESSLAVTSEQPVMRSYARTASDAGIMPADAGDNVTYNVVINYVFANNEIAADPYTANLAAGSNFSTTVTFPTIQGYLPYLDEVQQDKQELNIVDVQSDVIYNVVYKPTNVDYTVIHYLQNVDNDSYTEYEREALQGLTKSKVPEVANAYDGFYALPYEQATIAADGSTVVEVYYDRNYYLMTFDLGGGYGVEPIYARYGASVGDVGTPSRAGYTFGGWTPSVPSTVPVGGGTYKANWDIGDTTYTVVYWKENANDSNYSYWTHEVKTARSGDGVSGSGDKTESGFHFDHADQNVVVKGDGSSTVNVYYKRNTYTLYFMLEHEHREEECGLNCGGISWTHWSHNDGCYNCGSNDWEAAASFPNIKYGADTSYWWNQGPSGYRWRVSADSSRAYTYAPTMTNGDLYTYGEDVGTRYKYTIHYYEENTTNKVRPDNTYYRNSNSYSLGNEDYVAVPGFTCVTSGNTSANSNLEFSVYYRRNSYTLTFKSGSETTSGGTHLYEDDISGKYWVPAYTGDDAAGYEFEGWYTTEACLEGTKFNFTGAKMPYNDLILYAHWVPVTHSVEFYLDKVAYETEGAIPLSTVGDVPHGSMVESSRIPTPSNGDYTFVGWFYMDGETEKAFDFANMPVNKELKVYGKWSSTVLMPYTINYVYTDKAGKETTIADPTTGSLLAGNTKTFDAKGGEDLYNGYQEGYFPMVKSHSLTISIDDPTQNMFTFYYVQKDAVPYTVRYLIKNEDGAASPAIMDENGNEYIKAVNDNRKAVVTETFVVVPGYMPDAYQKRLVVNGTDGAVNEIIFYYSADTTHAYYKITHYTENLDGETWSEYASSQVVGDIGKSYNADAMTIDGFTYNPDVEGTVASGELTQAGLELKLYYTRNSYPYQVRYLEQGTGKELSPPTDGKGWYGQVISEHAIDIPNYTPVDPTSQTLNIRIEESETEAKRNIITFYYTEQEVIINYVVVGPDGCGRVDPEFETLNVVTGEAKGSEAAAADNTYKFVGWYSDEACTQQISTEAKYVPAKVDELNVAATYYAKFEHNLTTLTIEKKGDVESTETFIFNVTSGNQSFRVAITGNGSKVIGGLTVGDSVTVTEETAWSNRYTPSYTFTINETGLVPDPNNEGLNKVIITNSNKKDKWLYDEDAVHNNFKTGESTSAN